MYQIFQIEIQADNLEMHWICHYVSKNSPPPPQGTEMSL